jgi:hypothetical protein
MQLSQISGLLLVFLLATICQTGEVPQHRKARQISAEDVITISEEAMKKMSPKMKKYVNVEYAREFFTPIE